MYSVSLIDTSHVFYFQICPGSPKNSLDFGVDEKHTIFSLTHYDSSARASQD